MLPSACLVFMRRPVPVYGYDVVPFAAYGVAPRGASLEHAQVTEGKIVLGRIAGIELAQRVGDLLGGLPRQNFAPGEAEVSAELMDVRIDGNQQRARGDVPK